jgi:hypothetical protein
MKTSFAKILFGGVAAALVAPALSAATINLVTVGGNASIKLIQDRIPATVLTGAALTVNSTNSLIFRYTGTFSGKSVQWDFNLTGGSAAILDIENQNNVVLADKTFAKPNTAITIVAPQTIGIDPGNLQQEISLVAPVVYIKSNLAGNDLAGLTNITDRLASYLEASAGSLPTAYFGGNPLNNNIPANSVYFVGRNSASAVRQVIDANVYFAGTAYNYTTNAQGLPILYVDGHGNPSGAGSGTEVANIVKNITNSVGTVAAQDINGLPTLSYEGVSFSTANVINGTYPLWGYERYIYYPSGTLALTTDQYNLFQALFNAVSDSTYDHTSSLFVNKFVSYADVNAQNQRDSTFDGGPIQSTVY